MTNIYYIINVKLDNKKYTLTNEKTIIYQNQLRDALNYQWVQLDQNMRAKNSLRIQSQISEIKEQVATDKLRYMNFDFDGWF